MRWLDEMEKIALGKEEKDEKPAIEVTPELVDAVADKVVEKLTTAVDSKVNADEQQELQEQQEQQENNEGGSK